MNLFHITFSRLAAVLLVTGAACYCAELYGQVFTGDDTGDFPAPGVATEPDMADGYSSLASIDLSDSQQPSAWRFLWNDTKAGDEPWPGEFGLVSVDREFLSAVQKRILDRYASTKDEAKQKELKGFLQKAVMQEFAFRQASRKTELDRLRHELEQLTEMHEQREEQKHSIVTSRVDQLLRNRKGLGWEVDGPRSENQRRSQLR